MFNISLIKSLMSSKRITQILFDNDQIWYFVDDSDGYLSDENFEIINGEEFIKKKGFLNSKGPMSKTDIPVWVYKQLDTIQGVVVLENDEDLDRIDRQRIYTRF